jgi:hypothetical protein
LEWIITIAYLILFIVLINKWKFFTNSGLSKRLLVLFFLLKVIAGFALTYIYTYHYPNRFEADIFKYFDDSAPMYDALYSNPKDFIQLLTGVGLDNDHFFNEYFIKMNNWDRAYDSNVYNDSHTVIRANALIRIFSFGVFHVHTLVFCLLSFIGLVAIYRTAKKHVKNTPKLWIAACFLMPSILIWSSGVLKESILIFALGLLVFTLDKLLNANFSKKNIVLIIVSFVLLIYIKFYVLFSIIPAYFCFIIAKKYFRQTIYIYGISLIAFTTLAFNTQYLPGNKDFIEILVGKQKDFIRLSEWQHAQSGFELTPMENSFWGVAKVVPEAILNCFVRPFPWSAKSPLYVGAVIENILLLFFLFFAFWHLIQSKRFGNKILAEKSQLNLFLFCSVFVLILFTIIGLTTPIAGALVRYKIPALPYLMLGLLMILSQEKRVIPYVEKQLDRIL